MEHKIEHETMPLPEEKQLIREIKQLKHAREQLCANSGTQAEIQEAFDQKDSIEGRFKVFTPCVLCNYLMINFGFEHSNILLVLSF